ncbi:hypothetical protein EZV62_012933 [Acer yangbiense]|uniref:LOB domain-containing protein n=1 Tax=Acer yangbiense TaxID=1000413 RepID=A0A5C7HXE0_9ROSI|nr:hypothetical protein EZV62_012933 [Acer yangbiense]
MTSVQLVLNWGGKWKSHHGQYWYEGRRAKAFNFPRDANYDLLLDKVYYVTVIDRDHYRVSMTTVAHTFHPSMPIEIVDDEDVALLLRRENVDPLVCISIEEIGNEYVPNMGANLDDIVEGFTPTANIDTTSPRLIPDHDETEPQFNPIPNQFPSRTAEYEKARKVFGVTNIEKMLFRVSPNDRRATTDSIIMEGNARHDDPVLGLSGIILDLKSQVHSLKIEREALQQEYLASLLGRERPLEATVNVPQIIKDVDMVDQKVILEMSIDLNKPSGTSGGQSMEAPDHEEEEERKPIIPVANLVSVSICVDTNLFRIKDYFGICRACKSVPTADDKDQILSVAEPSDLEDSVGEEETSSEVASSCKKVTPTEFEQKNDMLDMALGTIILSLSDNVLREVNDEKTACNVWKKLESLYLTKSLTNKIYLKERLFSFKMDANKGLCQNLYEFKKMTIELDNAGVDKKLSDENEALILLNSLPDSFKDVKAAIKYGWTSLSLEECILALKSKDLKLKMEKDSVSYKVVSIVNLVVINSQITCNRTVKCVGLE